MNNIPNTSNSWNTAPILRISYDKSERMNKKYPIDHILRVSNLSNNSHTAYISVLIAISSQVASPLLCFSQSIYRIHARVTIVYLKTLNVKFWSENNEHFQQKATAFSMNFNSLLHKWHQKHLCHFNKYLIRQHSGAPEQMDLCRQQQREWAFSM